MKNTETQSPGSLHRMVRRLFEARQSATAAKKAMQLKAAEVGKCSGYMDEYSACYQSRKPKEEWCDICKVKLPLWEERQRTAAQSGAALRELLRVARTLPPNDGTQRPGTPDGSLATETRKPGSLK